MISFRIRDELAYMNIIFDIDYHVRIVNDSRTSLFRRIIHYRYRYREKGSRRYRFDRKKRYRNDIVSFTFFEFETISFYAIDNDIVSNLFFELTTNLIFTLNKISKIRIGTFVSLTRIDRFYLKFSFLYLM